MDQSLQAWSLIEGAFVSLIEKGTLVLFNLCSPFTPRTIKRYSEVCALVVFITQHYSWWWWLLCLVVAFFGVVVFITQRLLDVMVVVPCRCYLQGGCRIRRWRCCCCPLLWHQPHSTRTSTQPPPPPSSASILVGRKITVQSAYSWLQMYFDLSFFIVCLIACCKLQRGKILPGLGCECCETDGWKFWFVFFVVIETDIMFWYLSKVARRREGMNILPGLGCDFAKTALSLDMSPLRLCLQAMIFRTWYPFVVQNLVQ